MLWGILNVGFLIILTAIEGNASTFLADAGSFTEASFNKVRSYDELQRDVASVEVTARKLKIAKSNIEEALFSPGFHATDQLDLTIHPSMFSVTVVWKAYEKLNCVKKYLVAICRNGSSIDCPERAEEHMDDTMSMMAFRSRAILDQCTDYTLHITPIFNGTRLNERVVAFRTLSQSVEEAARLLTLVELEAQEDQVVKVRWNPIQCVAQYQVFRKINTGCGAWEKIGTTKENVFESKAAPCTEYKYGVLAKIENQAVEVEFDKAIMTKVNTSVPYLAENLAIKPTIDGAQLTWDRGMCIKSFRTRICQVLQSGIRNQDSCIERVLSVNDQSCKKRQISYLRYLISDI